jgi:hypothetical protein
MTRMSVFAVCRSLLPFAFDRASHPEAACSGCSMAPRCSSSLNAETEAHWHLMLPVSDEEGYHSVRGRRRPEPPDWHDRIDRRRLGQVSTGTESPRAQPERGQLET